MNKFCALAGAVILIISCGRSHVDSEMPSNFDAAGYPRHRCRQPVPPYSDDPLDRKFFQEALEQYRQCIREYARAAKNDCELIKEKANEAVEEFNAFVRGLDY